MILWWIGDLLLIAVVLPVVVILLKRVIEVANEINRTVSALARTAPIINSHLNGIPQLLRTQDLVHETTAGLARYGAALDEIL